MAFLGLVWYFFIMATIYDELKKYSELQKLKEKQKRLKHKFKASPCERNGIKFPSKLERAYYDKLLLLQKSGEVVFFLRQVGFDIPGNRRYFADFLVFWADGTADIVDTKGKDTEISKLKRDQVEELYPIKINIVKKV